MVISVANRGTPRRPESLHLFWIPHTLAAERRSMLNSTPHARPKSWGRERVVLSECNVQSDSTYLLGFPSPYPISAILTRVDPWPGGPPPAPPGQRARTSTFVELHAPAHSQTTTHKHKQMESSPLPPAPSCSVNLFSAAADSVCSLDEDSKAFLDASLDITGMLASPAPVRAVGDRQPPHQAEQQPLACYGLPLQQPHQQQQAAEQAAEQAKGAAVPDDSYEYLLNISDFPSPLLRVREGVAGTRGRGDDAGGNGAGEFASACMNPAAVIGNPTGSTMEEVNCVTGCTYGCIWYIRIFFVDPAVTDTYTYINHS